MEPKPKVKCEVCGKECINLGSHMKFHEAKDITKEDTSKLPETVVNQKPVNTTKNTKPIILKNIAGEDMDPADYFFKGTVPSGFNTFCGLPVDREDLVAVFNKIFDPKDNILFYKPKDKEVYIVIVPMKYSSIVGVENDSFEGDFQKHAISFINEGSVNLETLKSKLKRIVPFIKYSDR
jgi:hypothetical protein